jgi:hypothetical protein
MFARYDIREDTEGWSVFDVWTGRWWQSHLRRRPAWTFRTPMSSRIWSTTRPTTATAWFCSNRFQRSHTIRAVHQRACSRAAVPGRVGSLPSTRVSALRAKVPRSLAFPTGGATEQASQLSHSVIG